LSGIPESITLGLGTVLRPLLTIGKNEIDQYAQDQQLHWVEDPSNQKNEYDRNFLRNQVIPLIRQRWESCDKTVSRSARHCSEAQIIVSAVAEELFYPVFNRHTQTLCLTQLLAHKNTRQQLIIRHWFQKLGLKMPSLCFLERVQHEVIAAREDSDPVLEGQGYVIRRYRDNLYCLKQNNQEQPQDREWSHDESGIALTAYRNLSYQIGSAGILQEQWQKAKITIKFRSGGEKIRLPKRKENHTLKKLFQEAGIPPWERDLIPLIYMNGKLAAVGDLWISADFYHEKPDACLHFLIHRQEENPKRP
jgi:tRNA(Ile)-lysidine synthase